MSFLSLISNRNADDEELPPIAMSQLRGNTVTKYKRCPEPRLFMSEGALRRLSAISSAFPFGQLAGRALTLLEVFEERSTCQLELVLGHGRSARALGDQARYGIEQATRFDGLGEESVYSCICAFLLRLRSHVGGKHDDRDLACPRIHEAVGPRRVQPAELRHV